MTSPRAGNRRSFTGRISSLPSRQNKTLKSPCRRNSNIQTKSKAAKLDHIEKMRKMYAEQLYYQSAPIEKQQKEIITNEEIKDLLNEDLSSITDWLESIALD